MPDLQMHRKVVSKLFNGRVSLFWKLVQRLLARVRVARSFRDDAEKCSQNRVATENSESVEKTSALSRPAVMSRARSHTSRSLFHGSLVDFVAAWSWSSRSSHSATNSQSCLASVSTPPGSSRSIGYSGSGSTDVWPRCLNIMVLVKPATMVQWHRQASGSIGAGAQGLDGRQ
jgi:hypothetical protein